MVSTQARVVGGRKLVKYEKYDVVIPLVWNNALYTFLWHRHARPGAELSEAITHVPVGECWENIVCKIFAAERLLMCLSTKMRYSFHVVNNGISQKRSVKGKR